VAFGYQLLLDLYDCDLQTCDDLNLCYKYLDGIVEHLAVRKQAPPSVFRTDSTSAPHLAGLSGWVPLLESSVVIHTLTEYGYISIDIYSCRMYDVQEAIAFTRKFFLPARVQDKFIIRGQDFWADGRNAPRATNTSHANSSGISSTKVDGEAL
jgi:S-adenosylmethionine decarboxylase